MYDHIGRIVRATAGRDKGELFCVVGVDESGGFLLLANGKRRRVEKPKRKKPGHVELLPDSPEGCDYPAIQKMREGTLPTNKELRRALAAFRDQSRRV